MKMKKLFAFTLAETLIVMGIIGVVAALTIPNLNSSTNDKEKVAKVKKVYSNLQDAYGRAEASYGPVDEWFIGDSSATAQATRAGERFTEFMKVSKACKTTANAGCFKQSAPIYANKTASGYATFDASTSAYRVLLADGASVYFQVLDANCSNNTFSNGNSTTEAYYTCGHTYVDIDGPSKGKNMFGSDLFWFVFTKNGIYPMGSENDKYGNTSDNLKNNCFIKGEACAAWIIQNDNMDYLKATSGTCPNSKVLGWTANRTCK